MIDTVPNPRVVFFKLLRFLWSLLCNIVTRYHTNTPHFVTSSQLDSNSQEIKELDDLMREVSLKRIGKCLSGDNSNELKQLTKQFLVKIVADLTIPLRYY